MGINLVLITISITCISHLSHLSHVYQFSAVYNATPIYTIRGMKLCILFIYLLECVPHGPYHCIGPPLCLEDVCVEEDACTEVDEAIYIGGYVLKRDGFMRYLLLPTYRIISYINRKTLDIPHIDLKSALC